MSLRYSWSPAVAPGAVIPAAGGADPDWILRSTAAGVEVADRLATSAALTDWIVPDSTQDHVSVDTVVKPLGGTGSFKFDILGTDDTSSGSVCIPFTAVGAGNVIWYSFRVMCDDIAAYQQWCFNYETAAKLAILSRDANGSSPTGSNQVNEIVASMNYSANTFACYWQDGVASSVGPDVAFGGSDFIWQPKIDRGATPLTGNDPATGSAWTTGTGSKQERARYGGLYSAKSNAEYQQGIGDPISGAVKMQGGQWYTVTFRANIVALGGAGNRISMWVAKDGSPYELIIDSQNITLGNGPQYNGVTLLPYVSQRSPGGRQASLSGISGVSIVGVGGGTAIGAGSLEYVASTGAFRFKAVNDSYGTARYISAANGIYLMNLKSSLHNVTTTTNGSVTLPQSSITLTDASSFPAGGGSFVLGSPDTSNPGASHGNGEQYLEYTGKSGNTLTGCTGGTGLHDSGVPVRIASYIGVRVDNPALLPSSGTTTAAVTVASGRKDGAMWVADFIKSNKAINAYGGYPPLGISELEDFAATMSPGDWEVFSIPSLDNSMLFANGPTQQGILNGFGYNLQFDPVHNLLLFAGTSHTGGVDYAGAGGLFTYDINTHTCTRESYTGNSVDGSSGNVPLVGHGYVHLALDPVTGNMWFRWYGSQSVRQRLFGDTGESSWTAFSTIGGSWGNQVAGALVYFPELNGGAGGLVFVDVAGAKTTASDLTTWADATGAAPTGIGNLQQFGVRANGHVYFGGGNSSTKMWKLNASKVVTACADTPVECGSANTAVIVTHPNGVDLLAYERANGGNFYKYDAVADTWSGPTAHQIAASSIFAAAAVPDANVVFFLRFPGVAGTPSVILHMPP